MAAKAGHYDVVVIGAGSGGLTAARTAARFGARTLLVERLPRLGGDCTWYGCVPSKALIRCAHAMHEARHGARFGVAGLNTDSLTCDWQKVKDHVKSCQEHIYNQDDSPEILEAAGVEVRLGVHASFVDAKTLQLATVESTTPGGTELLTANHFIIATGAGPVIPPLKGLDAVKYATYETIFDLPEFPGSLAVIGGGPIGSELAQAFARLGCKVTLVGKMMPREDDDVRHVMSQVFEKDGIVVVEGRAESVEPAAAGIVLHAGGRSLTCAGLLLAAGRRPKGLDAMSLDRAGVKWSQNGIPVDAKLRTSAKHIYAVGDCLGGLQFTHLAGYQGALAAFNAVQPISLAGPGNVAVPRCTFTHPEVATVGLTMKEAADAHGIDKVSVKMRMLSHVDRAVCEGETEGFIKIIVGSGGVILGATVVAPAAGDVAQELGLAVAQRLTLRSVSTCIHSYPAMSFAIQQMAADHVYESLEKSSALSCLRCLCGPKLSGIKPSSSSDESS